MFGPLEGSGLMEAALMAMAAALVVFVGWNCLIDIRRPRGLWIDRAADAITQRLGRRLSKGERCKLRGLVRGLIADTAGLPADSR